MRALLLILALACAAASGFCGAAYLAKRATAHEIAKDPQRVLSVIEIAQCKKLLGAVVVTRDGIVHPFIGVVQEDLDKLESIIPAGNHGRMIISHGCDTDI